MMTFRTVTAYGRLAALELTGPVENESALRAAAARLTPRDPVRPAS